MALTNISQEKLDRAEREYEDLGKTLSEPGLRSRPEEIKRLARAMGELEPLVQAYRLLKDLLKEQAQLEEALAGEDADLAMLAREELELLKTKEAELLKQIALAAESRQRDPADARGAILEIRAGTGGEEAGLFAGDLLRMYLRYAERRNWRTEIVERHQTELGGIREAVVSIDGKDVWRWLKHEGGVHRVQRVPVTEASGRIHTSAVSVVALLQAEEVEVKIKAEDLRIDTFCSSGAGGQSVNTTYSAVRIVHIPTGLVVQCQDERSQVKNKARAMKVLRARLLAAKQEEQHAQRGLVRREQIKSGDRSEKMRTYNFPQNRVTDHRAGITLQRLTEVLDGDLDELLSALSSRLADHGRAGQIKEERRAA